MSDFSEFFKSITEGYKERLTTPFFRNFLIGFLIFNWRGLFYLITSEAPALERIYYFDNRFCDIKNFLIYPIAYSVIFTLIFHLIASLFDNPIYDLQKQRKVKRNNFLADIIKSREVVETAKIDLEEAKQKRLKLEDTNNEISRLKDELGKAILKHGKLNNELISQKEKNDLLITESSLKNDLLLKIKSMLSNLNDIKVADIIENELVFITNDEFSIFKNLTLNNNIIISQILKNQDLKSLTEVKSNFEFSDNNKLKFEELLDFLINHEFLYTIEKNNKSLEYKLLKKGELLKDYLIPFKSVKEL